MNELSNDELSRLLKQFALGQASDHATTRAQRAFYESVRRPLERTVSHALILRPELARMAAQEAWSQIFLSARNYDPAAGTVVAWIKGIALNCARRVLREEAQAKRLLISQGYQGNQAHSSDWLDDAPDAFDQAACPLPGPEQRAQATEVRDAVARCLDRLPAEGRVPYRQVYELAIESDLSNRELAELFNAQHPERSPCNEEQLRKWMARAGDKMRDCLGALLRLHPQPAR